MSAKKSGHIATTTRRNLLAHSSVGFGLTALTGFLSTHRSGLVAAEKANRNHPSRTQPQRAKRVIFCFMSGGVSAIDTFDPKPRVTLDHGKPTPALGRPGVFSAQGKLMASPWKFRRRGESGLPVSDLFPHIGSCADDLGVIRSMTSTASEHAQANYFVHTGFSLAGHPSAGAWTTYGLGSECEDMPGFVVLASGGPPLGGVNIYGSGYLPGRYQASLIDPSQAEPLANVVPRETSRRQRLRMRFIEQLDRQQLRAMRGEEQIESAIRNYEIAYRMQSAVPEFLDISDESKATRSLYGLDSPVKETAEYGRQCLLARRLAERGVRFIELTCLPRPGEIGQSGNPWDQHRKLKSGHTDMAQQVDQPIAGLIRDLKQRGLFDETLIVWAGEFGRTPYAEGPDGRDHNPYGFSVWLAGGGIKGGTTYGATDEIGLHAVENRSTVYDLWATVLHQLGVDHEALTYRSGGRDFRLTDVHGRVLHDILA